MYLHPKFSTSTTHGRSCFGNSGQLCRGMMYRPSTEVNTAPREKLVLFVSSHPTHRARLALTSLTVQSTGNGVTWVCSPRTCSPVSAQSRPSPSMQTHSVPSVGIDPPTPVPNPNRARHSQPNEGAKAESNPNIEVMRRVKLKAAVRPLASESVTNVVSHRSSHDSQIGVQLPHPAAPTCKTASAKGLQTQGGNLPSSQRICSRIRDLSIDLLSRSAL
jgi:hypothetical protein